MGAPILLPAAKQLKPLRQGDCDGLCCLYSIINAIRLVLHPQMTLSRAQTKALFVHGVHFLSHADSLLDTLEAGMDEPLWIRLAEELTKHASRSYKCQIDRTSVLTKRSKSTTQTALNAIRARFIAGNPVLMMLWGAYDHCTVAVGMTDNRLILFDSGGFRWVKLANSGCTTTDRHGATRCAKPAWFRYPSTPQGDGGGALKSQKPATYSNLRPRARSAPNLPRLAPPSARCMANLMRQNRENLPKNFIFSTRLSATAQKCGETAILPRNVF